MIDINELREAIQTFGSQAINEGDLNELLDRLEAAEKGRDGVKRGADSGEPVDQCDVPPIGWRCTRGEGHSGPCAAIECPEDVALVERGMRRLRETPNARNQRGA